MHVTGSCHCGAIRIEAEAKEDWVALCYCTDCQKFSGSAFRGRVQALRETMNVTNGNPKTYVKVGESGLRRVQAFCPDCGTSLYADYPDEHIPYVTLSLGFLDQREHLVPKVRLWRRSTLQWVERLDEAPSLEKQDFEKLA